MDPERRFRLFGERRDAANVVFGAVIGSYLGLALSRDGVSGGYLNFMALLLMLAGAVNYINSAGDRIHRKEWPQAAIYGIMAIAFSGLTWVVAIETMVDASILLSILGAWMLFMISSAFVEFTEHSQW